MKKEEEDNISSTGHKIYHVQDNAANKLIVSRADKELFCPTK
jgi:uncharacterized Zn-finger protein